MQLYYHSQAAYLKIHTGEKPYSCNHCEYKTTSSSGLRRHVMIHSGEKEKMCTICNYSCSATKDLKIHMMMKHAGERPHKCNRCNYVNAHSSDLKRHMVVNTGEELFKCNRCEKTSNGESSWQDIPKFIWPEYEYSRPVVVDDFDWYCLLPELIDITNIWTGYHILFVSFLWNNF